MNFTCQIILVFEFEHIQEKETFTNQLQDFTIGDSEIEEIGSLHIKITCQDWEDAESLEEFAESFTYYLAEY